ncbi:site-specific recombinase XerD [Flavobacterium gossypii]|uniref:Site-specific recombinase XerD n=1 Tax=Flavobacterium gossypii TaxID=1646119 RepID=A0ABR6DTY0_9FLAO|nr:site-specific integrase [Flavobacterium gossypii]MBA9074721.1 site-specific recombinase XerD [Flavobacterium gossypii]
MESQFIYLESIIPKVEEYLYVNLNFTPIHIDFCKRDWKRIRIYLASRGYTDFSLDYESEICQYFLPQNAKGRMSRVAERMKNSITALCEFIRTSKISLRTRSTKNNIIFTGEIGIVIEQFLHNQKIQKRLSYIRTCCYQRQLIKFYNFCKTNDTISVSKIDLPFLLNYINQIDPSGTTTVETAIGVLRGFMKYLFLDGLTDIDFSIAIPRYKSVRQPDLSASYSQDEIELLIKSIDRTSPSGKRNYAMILLMARLGLRASDVSNLKFENIDWESDTITLSQVKTGREVILPLLPDVGNAIIDYLKYGRAKSYESLVFLSCVPPYNGLVTGSAISSRVRDIFKKAGIKTEGKRYGSHSLRHSLGFRLLQESTAIPVISEILGHQNTQSTKYYLRIDIQSMKSCMLYVPPVPKDFYEQKESFFYGG